jgi:succinylarginine dihydrolase
VVAGVNPVKAVHYLDLRQSMNNGGGPACLRQRIGLTDAEAGAIRANVFLTDALLADLEAWIRKHYRDRLLPRDLGDPALAREGMTALDELTGLLRLGSVYDFQLTPAS